jgi:hypothetical protein
MTHNAVGVTLLLITALLCTRELRSQPSVGQEEKRKDLSFPLLHRDATRGPDSAWQQSGEGRVLAQIESGISSGDGGRLVSHLGPQLYLSLRGFDGGYYSSNQAAYILRNFFSTNRVVAFSFSTVGGVGSNPFATGRGQFITPRGRESLQLYVSLTFHEGRWVIAEFNAY